MITHRRMFVAPSKVMVAIINPENKIQTLRLLVNLGNSRATGSLCSSRFNDSGDAPLGNMEDWSKQSRPGFDVMKMS